MRVTNQMIASQTLQNIGGSLRRLDRYNHQLSTGKRINVPSDDPAGTEIAMRLQTTILETEQYLANVEDAESWLNATDSALNQVTQTLHRARELSSYGANGTLPDKSLEALAKEVDQLLDDLVQVGNQKQGQKYLFGGENTLEQPLVPTYGTDGVSISAVQYVGTTGNFETETNLAVRSTLGIEQEIGPGITMRVSVHGDVALEPAIDAMMDLRDNLRAGDIQALSTSTLEKIDEAMDTVIMWRAEAGSRANRLQHVRDRLEQTHTNMNRLLSERTDVDIAETIMNLKMEENVYRAALASGARIIQPTLLDFLR